MPKSNSYFTPHEVRDLLADFGKNNWYRATSYARLLCLDLPHLTAKDLLHEAIVQFLENNRRCPRHVDLLTSLYLAMRSIASHVRVSAKNGPIDHEVTVVSDVEHEDYISDAVSPISLASPEKIAQDRELIARVDRFFEDDYEVRKLLHLWSEGVLGNDAALELGLSPRKYDAARVRLRRALAAYKLRSF